MRSRRNILDDAKRRMIIALVTQGSSRRVAGRFVGCAASTITRTALRDPDFAVQLARAEQMAEVNLLRAVQKAAKEPKHWRAAAWLLERRNPEDFAARQPSVVTSVQIADFIGQIVELIDDELPHENYRRAMRKINQWLVDNQAAYQPILVGVAEDASEDPPPAAASHGKHKRISHLTGATGHPRA